MYPRKVPYPMGVRAAATTLTLECAMMISTRNRDEKSGPPFMNTLHVRVVLASLRMVPYLDPNRERHKKTTH